MKADLDAEPSMFELNAVTPQAAEEFAANRNITTVSSTDGTRPVRNPARR